MLLSLHSRKVRLPDFLNEYLLESLTKELDVCNVADLPRFCRAGRVFCGSCKTNGYFTSVPSLAIKIA